MKLIININKDMEDIMADIVEGIMVATDMVDLASMVNSTIFLPTDL